MRKGYLLVGVLLLLVLCVFTASAATPTTVDVYWDGSGAITTDFYSGDDMHSWINTGGSYIHGEFHVTDANDNPYNYGVDTSWVQLVSKVTSGYIEFATDRLDSYEHMYGNAGQTTYSYLSTSGTGEVAFYNWINYAGMRNCNYAKPTTTNSVHFEASGDYYIFHSLTDSDNDGVQVYAHGSGTAKIKLLGEESAASSFNMGRLPVCGDGCAWYGNYATFTGSGIGIFGIDAWADNSLTIGSQGYSFSIPGDGSDNSAQYHMWVQYAGTWNTPDFGVAGN